MDRMVLDYLRDLRQQSPASHTCLTKLTEAFGGRLPRDYLDLLEHSNGLEGFIGKNYLSFWPAENVIKFGVYDALPFLIFIGSNGAGEGFAFDTRQAGMPIVNVPFIAMEEQLIRVLGRSIFDFVERLATRPLWE